MITKTEPGPDMCLESLREMGLEPLQFQVRLTSEEIRALARVLDAEARGIGYTTSDGKVRDDLITHLVCKAKVLHGVGGAAVSAVVKRFWDEFRRGSHKSEIPSTNGADDELGSV